ncbi:hypothetical protein S7335_4226 [Synechococcus sp. PCC 7335]|nr:hypothetical protein S7335_4226 [Synechococcus sp. PCC 7335]
MVDCGHRLFWKLWALCRYVRPGGHCLCSVCKDFVREFIKFVLSEWTENEWTEDCWLKR